MRKFCEKKYGREMNYDIIKLLTMSTQRREGMQPYHNYLRQCTSPEGFRTSPKQSSKKDLPFIIVNFYT